MKFAPTLPTRMEDPRNSPAQTVKQKTASPSKLMNRYKKKGHDISDLQASPIENKTVEKANPEPPKDTKNSKTSFILPPSDPHISSDVVILQEELLNVKAERDELLMEKSFWLSKFQSDNANLLRILISTRDVKTKMLQEIDSLEKEKDRMKSLQLDGVEASLLDRVLDNSPLAEANRGTLPAHLRGRADELHKTLTTLATKCRSNQLELFEMVITKVEDIETQFLNRNDEAVENAVTELKNIASSSPGNVLAAVNVSKKYPEMMLSALIEKRDDAIRDESLRTHGGAELGGSADSKDMKGTMDDVTKTLMAQNNTLRATVAQLRKKNAEVKNKLSQFEDAANDAALMSRTRKSAVDQEEINVEGTVSQQSGSKQKPRRGSLFVGGQTTNINNPSSDTKSFEESKVSNEGGNIQFVDTPTQQLDVPPTADSFPSSEVDSSTPYLDSPRKRASVMKGAERKSVANNYSRNDNSFDALPDFVKDMAWGPIVNGISEIAMTNPLSLALLPSVLQGTLKEVAYHSKETVASALWILGGRDRWANVQADADAHTEYKDMIIQAVNKCLHSPQGIFRIIDLSINFLTCIHDVLYHCSLHGTCVCNNASIDICSLTLTQLTTACFE